MYFRVTDESFLFSGWLILFSSWAGFLAGIIHKLFACRKSKGLWWLYRAAIERSFLNHRIRRWLLSSRLSP